MLASLKPVLKGHCLVQEPPILTQFLFWSLPLCSRTCQLMATLPFYHYLSNVVDFKAQEVFYIHMYIYFFGIFNSLFWYHIPFAPKTTEPWLVEKHRLHSTSYLSSRTWQAFLCYMHMERLAGTQKHVLNGGLPVLRPGLVQETNLIF